MNTYAHPQRRDEAVSSDDNAAVDHGTVKTSLQFAEAEPNAKRLAGLGELANGSARSTQLAQLQDLATNNPRAERISQLQSVAAARDSTSAAGSAIAARPNNTGLPDSLKAGIENLSGVDMSDVSVHRNSSRPAQFQAHALAQGPDIHLAPGQEKHLPHEAWHVVQQKQGRVQPTRQLRSMAINDDAALEAEADAMGAKALLSGPIDSRSAPTSNAARPATQTVQRVSAFSKWFIQNVMPAGLKLVPGINKPDYISLESHYLNIDDSRDDEWDVAEGFLQVVFLKYIPVDELEQALAALDVINKELTTRIAEFRSQRGAAVHIERQIRELEGSLRAGIEERNTEETKETLRQTREYVSARKEAWQTDSPESYSDVLLSGASYMLLNPSSSAHYLDHRADEDKPTSHGRQENASRYHRSAKHPMFAGTTAKMAQKLVAPKAANQTKLGNGGAAHVGVYPNAFTYRRAEDMPRRKPAGGGKRAKRGKSGRGGRRGGKTPPSVQPPTPSVQQPDDIEEVSHGTPGRGDLYDASLAYKLTLCQRVVELSKGLTRLTPGVYHDYPLVMVHFDLKAFLEVYKKGVEASDGAIKAFTSFLMNYYMGLVNFTAKSAGIDIAIVERSSFGFNTPSVAQTGESFRINMGLMPPVYANVHADALHLLNSQLEQLLEHKAPRDAKKHAASLHSSDPYFADKDKTDAINAIGDWLEFSMYPVESTGKSAIGNAIRNRPGLDFANARAFNLAIKRGKDHPSMATVMQELFEAMTLADGTLSTNVGAENTRYGPDAPAKRTHYEATAKDTEQFEGILALIRRNVVKIGEESKDTEFKKQLGSLVHLLHANNRHIDVTFDLLNEMLLIHAMHEVERENAPALGDSYGSDSEAEEEEDKDEDKEKRQEIAKDKDADRAERKENDVSAMDLTEDTPDIAATKRRRVEPPKRSAEPKKSAAEPPESPAEPSKRRLLTGKKIITHNGMRALLSAIDSAAKVVYLIPPREKLNVNAKGAYYELNDALAASTVKAQVTEDADTAHALVRDINSCVTTGPKGKIDITADLESSQAGVWIIDTTSASQRQMAALVEAFRNKKTVRVLYLVSSGFKQEQFGADRNQYGTIRAFTDKGVEGKRMLDEILDTTKKTDKPLAVTAHLYRRLMKRLGAVPSNKNILSGAKTAGGSLSDLSGTSISSSSGPTSAPSEASRERARQREIRTGLLEELRQALAEVLAQGDDPGAERADHSQPASRFVYATAASSTSSSSSGEADKSWFDIVPNDGGGDCLLHALAGRNLSFDEVLERRNTLASAVPDVMRSTVSGSTIHQSLLQSDLLNGRMNEAIANKHQVPAAAYARAVKVPGLYAGEDEIRMHCRIDGTTVYVVTAEGELRRVTASASTLVTRVSTVGEAEFRNRVAAYLAEPSIVLYKTRNHWEKINAVTRPRAAADTMPGPLLSSQQ